MRLLLALLGPALLVAAVPALAADRTIEPGYWETTDQVVSPLPQTKTERRCIRPEDVAKFMQGPSNHIYACTYPTREVHAGKIRLEGTCTSKHSAPLPVTGQGVYGPGELRLDVELSTKLGGLTIPVHMRTTAHRLGDECPPAPAAAAPAPAG